MHGSVEKSFLEVTLTPGHACEGQDQEWAEWYWTDEVFYPMTVRSADGVASDAELIRMIDLEVAKWQELCPQAYEDATG